MATINNIYVLVESEDIDRSTQVPQHPTETGYPITDNVKKEPKPLSISGKIADTKTLKAKEIIEKLEAFQDKGSLVKYVGVNILGNYLIKNFHTTEDSKNWGGANFDMELVEVRIAKSAYNPEKSSQQSAEKDKQLNNPTLEIGALVVFKGGSVYVSSDAKKAAATRGRQTCKITNINNKSWGIHSIHLISTEKVYPYNVYGWVDKADIEGTGVSSGTVKTSTSPVTNAGTQQVKTGTKTDKREHVLTVKEKRLSQL